MVIPIVNLLYVFLHKLLMGQMITISIKIPKALKDKIKKSGKKVSPIVRSALEKEILLDEAHKLNADVKKHKNIFNKISVEDVVRDIREDRDRR